MFLFTLSKIVLQLRVSYFPFSIILRYGEAAVGLPDFFDSVRLREPSVRPTLPSERFVQLRRRQLQALAKTRNPGQENWQLKHTNYKLMEDRLHVGCHYSNGSL